jgi:uncharacterized protein
MTTFLNYARAARQKMPGIFRCAAALLAASTLCLASAQQRTPAKNVKIDAAAAAAATNALILGETSTAAPANAPVTTPVTAPVTSPAAPPVTPPITAAPAPAPAPKSVATPNANNTATAFLWEVKSKSNTVYLFGTVHVGKSEFYPLAPVIEDAFKRSKKIVVEADITKADESKEIDSLITFAPPDSLESKISEGLFERVREQLTRLKIPVDGVKNMKPFIVGGFLAVTEFTRLGYDMKYGVDAYLIEKAAKEKKPVIELESQLGQIKMLSNMTPVQQEAFLENAVVAIESGASKEQVVGLVKAWKAGDTKLMQTVAKEATVKGKLTEELDELLIYSRHAEMLKKVEGYLAASESHFIAVGSLHLVGSRGLIELLRAKGYQVRQL